jgi:DNA polymerase-3 subunit delta
MRLGPEQLSSHLRKTLLPVYLVTGDEPLQAMEAMDALRGAARERGHVTREVLEVNKEFSWGRLNDAASSMSLFAEKRILELRLPSGSPGADGGQALVEYAQRPADDAVLLIQAGKIDKRSQSAKWFTVLEKIGAVVTIWPVKPAALPQWLQQRCLSHGLQLDRDALALLASRVEGNLLSAAQEVEKLALLYGVARDDSNPKQPVRLDLRQVADAVSDSARYSVYDLVDAAAAGEAARSVRILNGLREEGVACPLILWALSNEIRNLSQFAYRLAAGESQGSVLAQVWESRKRTVTEALKRLPLPIWSILLQRCLRADQVIKGILPGREWDELLQICLGLAGPHLFREPRNA